MAKNTNKKIKELKAEKPSKISNEELNQVQSVINDINRAQLEVGIMESRKHSALHSIANINDKITLLQGEFEKDYGTFDIDIENGTINYPKENGEVNKKD